MISILTICGGVLAMLFTLYALTLIAQLADENNPSDTFRVKLAVFSLIYVLFYLIFVVGWMGRLP